MYWSLQEKLGRKLTYTEADKIMIGTENNKVRTCQQGSPALDITYNKTTHNILGNTAVNELVLSVC